MCGAGVDQQALDRLVQPLCAPVRIALFLVQRDPHVLPDALAQHLKIALRVFDPAEMCQAAGSGAERHHVVEAGEPGVRIERNRGRRGDDQRFGVLAKFPVAEAEGVAGEQVAACVIENAAVMVGVPRGMQELQGPPTQFEALQVVGGGRPLLGDRQNVAEQLLKLLLAVHRGRAGLQFARVDHVRQSFRVHHQHRIPADIHQSPGAPGMIEVHVGRDHIAHLPGGGTDLGDRFEHLG